MVDGGDGARVDRRRRREGGRLDPGVPGIFICARQSRDPRER